MEGVSGEAKRVGRPKARRNLARELRANVDAAIDVDTPNE